MANNKACMVVYQKNDTSPKSIAWHSHEVLENTKLDGSQLNVTYKPDSISYQPYIFIDGVKQTGPSIPIADFVNSGKGNCTLNHSKYTPKSESTIYKYTIPGNGEWSYKTANIEKEFTQYIDYVYYSGLNFIVNPKVSELNTRNTLYVISQYDEAQLIWSTSSSSTNTIYMTENGTTSGSNPIKKALPLLIKYDPSSFTGYGIHACWYLYGKYSDNTPEDLKHYAKIVPNENPNPTKLATLQFPESGVSRAEKYAADYVTYVGKPWHFHYSYCLLIGESTSPTSWAMDFVWTNRYMSYQIDGYDIDYLKSASGMVGLKLPDGEITTFWTAESDYQYDMYGISYTTDTSGSSNAPLAVPQGLFWKLNSDIYNPYPTNNTFDVSDVGDELNNELTNIITNYAIIIRRICFIKLLTDISPYNKHTYSPTSSGSTYCQYWDNNHYGMALSVAKLIWNWAGDSVSGDNSFTNKTSISDPNNLLLKTPLELTNENYKTYQNKIFNICNQSKYANNKCAQRIKKYINPNKFYGGFDTQAKMFQEICSDKLIPTKQTTQATAFMYCVKTEKIKTIKGISTCEEKMTPDSSLYNFTDIINDNKSTYSLTKDQLIQRGYKIVDEVIKGNTIYPDFTNLESKSIVDDVIAYSDEIQFYNDNSWDNTVGCINKILDSNIKFKIPSGVTQINTNSSIAYYGYLNVSTNRIEYHKCNKSDTYAWTYSKTKY